MPPKASGIGAGWCEDVAKFEGEGAEAERFLQEVGSEFMDVLEQASIIGVSGHVNHFETGAQAQKHLRQLSSAHVRHNHIRDQEVDVRVDRGERESLLA